MKKYKSLFILFSILIFSTCTKDFGEINTNPNPTEPDSIDPKLQFSYILNKASSESFEQWRGNLMYCSEWVQHLSGDWEPDRYNTTDESWLNAWWNSTYLRVGKDVIDLINTTEAGSNIQSMAIIFKVYFFQKLTDMHGDIPYSEANQGAVFAKPKYDTQQNIYNSFINELKTAINNLDAGKDDVGTADLLYDGDISKWKKFGNSVLLRIAMRISNVDPDLAKETGKLALENGVMMSNDDMAYITFSGSNPNGKNANGIGEIFQNFGGAGHRFRYSDEVVNFVINNDDPREDNLMETYKSDGEVDNTVGSGNHLGRPNGIPTGTNDFVFAQPNKKTIMTYDAPAIYMSFAEVEFLRAEAILLNWITGDVKEAYENGVYAACQQFSFYPNAEPIDNDDIEDYLEENDIEYDASRAKEQINTQKWMALLFDGFEAYANYRRSGFPNLTPGLADGESNGEIPRRLRYTRDEKDNNTENYNEAVSRLNGGDVITSRMWWDVD
ncbi:MAG: SusD/RagB family nutrient-binding outer membrane lipoprotein [Saprospiraceae bacterium]